MAIKILFQGDSITDAGRDRSDIQNLGWGYPRFAAQNIKLAYPDREFIFMNTGISGDRAESLRARWQADCIDLQPDILSIMIGVNDTWHRAGDRNWMPHEYFEECYRDILTQAKEKTNAKIIIIEQFLCYTDDKAYFRCDLDPKIQITRRLAREFADAFIPTDGLFASESIKTEPTYWAADGVHPTEAGSWYIGQRYLEAVKKILN